MGGIKAFKLFEYGKGACRYKWEIDGKIYITDENCKGIMEMNPSKGTCRKIAGADEFWLIGLSKSMAKKKVTEFFKDRGEI